MLNFVEVNQVLPSAYLSGGECHGLYPTTRTPLSGRGCGLDTLADRMEETREPLNASLSSACLLVPFFVLQLCHVAHFMLHQRVPFQRPCHGLHFYYSHTSALPLQLVAKKLLGHIYLLAPLAYILHSFLFSLQESQYQRASARLSPGILARSKKSDWLRAVTCYITKCLFSVISSPSRRHLTSGPLVCNNEPCLYRWTAARSQLISVREAP